MSDHMNNMTRDDDPPVAVYFFDSHGSLWKTCESTSSGAENFGPTGCARQFVKGPHWPEAHAQGWVFTAENGEDVLTPEGRDIALRREWHRKMLALHINSLETELKEKDARYGALMSYAYRYGGHTMGSDRECAALKERINEIQRELPRLRDLQG